MPEQQETPEVSDDRATIMAVTLLTEISAAVIVGFILSNWTIIGGILAGLVVFTVSFFMVAYFIWAPNNLCFTFVDEGTAKMVMLGGKFQRVLIQWEGHTLDDKGNVVLDKKNKEPWHLLGGFRFYGWWPFWDIYLYDFSWTAMLQSGDPKHHEDEKLDYVLLMTDVYWFRIEKAEDKNRLPLNLEMLASIRVINPYKALFEVQDWLEFVIGRLQPRVRDQVTQQTYERFTVAKDSIGDAIFQGSKHLLDRIFKKKYGVELLALEVKEIDPPEELREITLKSVRAKREKEAVLIQADGEARRLKRIYGQIEAHGDTGRLVRTLEALEKSPGEGSKWVLPLPGMADVISQVFGKK